jgi:two-component system nitrogen regulation sensor histidine kinase NtrY
MAQQALFLQQAAHPEINYSSILDDHSLTLSCDRRQVAQALTNLLQNSADSIEERAHREGAPVAGEIELRLEESAGRISVEVIDNGVGLPLEQRGRLMEPYVTTRDKGTGLGLAIVRKIMEDHGGQLTLEDRSAGGGQGARARLTFYPDGMAEKTLPVTPPQPAKVASHGA